MYYIGVDLGGTNIAIGIVDENKKIILKGSNPTNPARDGELIIKDMAALAEKRSYSSCWECSSFLMVSSSTAGKMSEMDVSASCALR